MPTAPVTASTSRVDTPRAREPELLTTPAAPWPSARELGLALRTLATASLRPVRPNDLDSRDEDLIAGLLPLMNAMYDGYFRCETELEAEIPDGPVLVVANHNGMTGTPDMFCHMTAFWRRYGVGRLGYGLMHDMPFSVPAAGAWLNAAGAIAANRINADRALDRGAAVLVFPGGDVDACKPFRDRYKIDFGSRRGFIRLALERRIPIVPVVSAGAHESLFIYSRGDALAQRLRLDKRFRSNVFPIGFALPWGLVVGVPYPHLPPPVKIHTRILRPIVLDAPPSASADRAAVEAIYGEVVGKMQRAMNELRDAGRHGLFPRATVRNLLSNSFVTKQKARLDSSLSRQLLGSAGHKGSAS